MTKLSTRAQTAINVLANGGRFVKRLERNSYTMREQFATRLIVRGQVVRGIGPSAFYEIENMLVPTGEGTSVSSYYALRAGWAG